MASHKRRKKEQFPEVTNMRDKEEPFDRLRVNAKIWMYIKYNEQ